MLFLKKIINTIKTFIFNAGVYIRKEKIINSTKNFIFNAYVYITKGTAQFFELSRSIFLNILSFNSFSKYTNEGLIVWLFLLLVYVILVWLHPLYIYLYFFVLHYIHTSDNYSIGDVFLVLVSFLSVFTLVPYYIFYKFIYQAEKSFSIVWDGPPFCTMTGIIHLYDDIMFLLVMVAFFILIVMYRIIFCYVDAEYVEKQYSIFCNVYYNKLNMKAYVVMFFIMVSVLFFVHDLPVTPHYIIPVVVNGLNHSFYEKVFFFFIVLLFMFFGMLFGMLLFFYVDCFLDLFVHDEVTCKKIFPILQPVYYELRYAFYLLIYNLYLKYIYVILY
jgi:hypothetical protein